MRRADGDAKRGEQTDKGLDVEGGKDGVGDGERVVERRDAVCAADELAVPHEGRRGAVERAHAVAHAVHRLHKRRLERQHHLLCRVLDSLFNGHLVHEKKEKWGTKKKR